MFSSLRNRVLVLLVLLVAIILFQAFLNWNNQSHQSLSQERVAQAAAAVELVRELERDVIDLQRNVLIYKATGSASASARFAAIMEGVLANLNQLRSSTELTGYRDTYLDYIDRLQRHTNDYSDNFETVVASKRKQDRLLRESIEPLIADLNASLDESDSNVISRRLHLAKAERAILRYVAAPDYSHLDVFKSEMDKLSAISNEDDLATEINQLSRDFLALAQQTRSYLFLVNVVMAGSANEFLFLSREMIDIAHRERETVQVDVTRAQTNASTRDGIVAIACVALAIILAAIIDRSIISPIQRITSVFGRIISGEVIDTIPGTERQDEIGKLSQAAGIFYEHSMIQKRLNGELRIAKKKADQATESKSLFLANMSHEIRTPINGVSGLLSLCLKTDLSETQRNYVQNALHSSNLLVGIVNDILDFSKIEAGKLELEQVPFDLDVLLQQALSSIKVRAREKNLSVIALIDPALKTTYIGDPLRISQILLNLLNNAVKFTEAGTITLKVGQAGMDRLAFSVIDTGIGMTRKQLASVFQAFTQADDSVSRKFGGTGLGLSIVQQLTELMDGEVRADSSPGIGSTFCIELGLASVAEANTLFSAHDQSLPTVIVTSCTTAEQMAQYLPTGQNFTAVDSLEAIALDAIPTRIIIGIERYEQALKLESQIQSLRQAGHLPGLLIELSATHEDGLWDRFQLPVLQSPVTPGQFIRFLEQFSPEQISDEAPADEIKALKLEGHVLIVEDNAINQIVAEDMLEEYGLTCDLADNGQIALNKIQSGNHYDLVLMDVQMPVMDGFEATRQLRKLGYGDLPICGLSANAMNRDIKLAFEVGMDDYIAKPIDWNELEAKLMKYLVPASAA